MLFLNHFDPSDVSPDLIVDREDDVTWLRKGFEAYFDEIERRTLDTSAKRIVCVTGDKGTGKSIVVQKVVKELRKNYSGSTLFVSVDCRGDNGARGVVAASPPASSARSRSTPLLANLGNSRLRGSSRSPHFFPRQPTPTAPAGRPCASK